MKAECVIGGLIALAVIAVLSVPAATAPAAAAGAKSDAVKLESIPGSPVKRITLSETAAKRLGIETGTVSKQPIVRRQMGGGLVVAQPEKQPATASPGSGGSIFGSAKVAGLAAPTASPTIHRVAAVATAAPARDAWVAGAP